jgi:hypothetical protein
LFIVLLLNHATNFLFFLCKTNILFDFLIEMGMIQPDSADSSPPDSADPTPPVSPVVNQIKALRALSVLP